MRIGFSSLLSVLVAIVALSSAGCGSSSTETATTSISGSPPPLAAEADDGDHAGHDHGDQAGDAHPTEGPHGGHLIELGNEEYHAELLHDENTHTVTIHLLDAAGKQPVSIASPEIALQVFQNGQFTKHALKAVEPQDGAAGNASRFELVDAGLCDALCHEANMRGRLQVTISGTQYTGDLENSSHDEHDHGAAGHEDHGDDGHKDAENGHE